MAVHFDTSGPRPTTSDMAYAPFNRPVPGRPPVCYSHRTCCDEERATTHSVWHDATHANCYDRGVLIGNWVETRQDVGALIVRKPLESDFQHYYDSTYHVDYDHGQQAFSVPRELINLRRRHPRSYHSHQPELDSAHAKAIYNSWQTTSGAAFVDPRFQRDPNSLAFHVLSDVIIDPRHPCFLSPRKLAPRGADPASEESMRDDESLVGDATFVPRRLCPVTFAERDKSLAAEVEAVLSLK